MTPLKTARRTLLGATAIAAALALASQPAVAQEQPRYEFNISAQPLSSALRAYGVTADQQIVFTDADLRGRTAPPLKGSFTADEALRTLLAGTGLYVHRRNSGLLQISASPDPQGGSAAGDGAEVEALVVTAQKREEDIQDVPIAISAFSSEALQAQKIEGGFDLLKAIPNVTFSKNNFSSYNFSIRGIGTKAISVTTDPGVAVEFNDTPLIRNRLFEQEYFDVERVEVLRGPQGTLHGRNATAGVINVISAKPKLSAFDGWVKGEVGNYHTKRASAMVNIPLIKDVLAVRLAGALTDRQGYDYNSITKNAVNGRDLWSARLTLAWEPTDRLRANAIWERFDEDDNRSRTGKQLCHRDPGKNQVGSRVIPEAWQQGAFSQGCKPGSLYDDDAFGTPNGFSIPFIQVAANQFPNAAGALGPMFNNPAVTGCTSIGGCFVQGGQTVGFLPRVDPYGGMMQSRDLRTIASLKDPVYRAKTDVFELNVSFDLTDSVTFTSQTAYLTDSIYSFQDYNRFNTVPIFADSSSWYSNNPDDYFPNGFSGGYVEAKSPLAGLSPGGVFCDPQLGCSDTIAGFDISTAKSKQFSQEFRLQSDFDGPFNFSVGANYLRYQTLEDYYVMFNLVTMTAMAMFNNSADPESCGMGQFFNILHEEVPIGTPDNPNPAAGWCTYIDPNPVESINGDGHNYYRNKNPYKLNSAGLFGEVYWQIRDNLKLTAGLRYSDDLKVVTPVPTQLLVNRLTGPSGFGYPTLPEINQHWGEWSGRIGFDWKPELSFTDQTMLYAFISRGYKGGGANPPGVGFYQQFGINEVEGVSVQTLFGGFPPEFVPPTFEPEFINAYEVGTKNTLLGGGLIINSSAFFYDYDNYQVSQIKERTAVNENFDAKVWGLEFESVFSPARNLRFNASLGYQGSRIADGETSFDLMDRLQGHEDEYVLAKAFATLPSNCVLPIPYVETAPGQGPQFCPGWGFAGITYDDPRLPNQGQGFKADVSGNELPNAPHWTVSLGGQYTHSILDGSWQMTVRADGYWQSQSWARVYNDNPYDKLHGWYNANLSIWVERPDDGLKIELYAKNLLDKTPITDAFLNSDDTALTTNVFVLDPRLIGLSIRKEF